MNGIAHTESPNPVFRLFKSVRDAMGDPERVEISVDDTELTFRPSDDGDESLKVTPGTGDISAAGLVSKYELDIEEGRYDAVSADGDIWTIDVGEGEPEPASGKEPVEEQMRDALEADTLEDEFTVDEIRTLKSDISNIDLLEDLIERETHKSAVDAFESRVIALSSHRR